MATAVGARGVRSPVSGSERAGRLGLARLRLQAQGIAPALLREPHEIVERLGAVQAQDYLGALWAVGLRLRRAGEADVERALARATIVRTWPMRGTLHLVSAPDVRWMLALLAPRAIARSARRYRELGLDDATFGRSAEVLARALSGGRRLTRPAALALLQRAGVSTAGQRGIHVLQRFAMDGLLCLGPREGKQHTFVLLDEWVPSSRRLGPEEALAEIAVRYFGGHGPATAADFAWWTGLAAADVRVAIELAAPRLARERREGRLFLSGPLPRIPAGPTPGAVLLPAFDELVVGYTDRSALLDPVLRGRLTLGAGGMLAPVLVVDGRVVGTWRRTLARGGVTVAPAPFAPLGRAGLRALSAACERYGAFLGVPLVGLGAPARRQRRRRAASRL